MNSPQRTRRTQRGFFSRGCRERPSPTALGRPVGAGRRQEKGRSFIPLPCPSRGFCGCEFTTEATEGRRGGFFSGGRRQRSSLVALGCPGRTRQGRTGDPVPRGQTPKGWSLKAQGRDEEGEGWYVDRQRVVWGKGGHGRIEIGGRR